LADDLKKYLEEKPVPEKEEKKSEELPFMAWVKSAFGSLSAFQEQTKALYSKISKIGLGSKETWNIARLMLRAEYIAKNRTFTCFDIYKKAHGMLSWPT
jgi:hypothetical protein